MDASPSSVRDYTVAKCVVLMAVFGVVGAAVAVFADLWAGIIFVLFTAVVLTFVVLEATDE